MPSARKTILILLGLGLACCSLFNKESLETAKTEPESTNHWTLQPALAQVKDARAVSIPEVAERILPSVVSVASTRVASSETLQPGFQIPDLFRRFFPDMGPGPGMGPGDAPGLPGLGPGLPLPEQRGLGSGVVIADGIVVTNHHVVADADTITVTAQGGREFDATVKGRDPQSDLAVLRLKGDAGSLPKATLGDSNNVRLGEIVLAVGNPFGVGQTVTMGIVSAKGRADVGIADYEDFIQTDAAINPGNSGGALVNMGGQVVGINTAILSRSGGYMGIGFAVPSAMVKPIVTSLLEHGKVERGWLGVSIQNVDQDLAAALELDTTQGVLVASVEPGSPADKAGLQRRDVIVKLNDRTVDTTGRLRNLVAAAGVGETVQLEVIRSGKRRKLPVKLGERPAEVAAGEPSGTAPTPAGVDGIEVAPLTPSLREQLGVTREQKGVVVAQVDPRGAAARAGLRRGDVIMEVADDPVHDVASFKRAWKEAPKKTLLVVSREGRNLFLVVDRAKND